MTSRYGILLRSDRVAPRCRLADGLMVAVCSGGRIVSASLLPMEEGDWTDLSGLLRRLRIDSLVCGGIRRDLKRSLLLEAVHVVDNVALTADEVLQALEAGALYPGMGFAAAEGSRLEGTFADLSGRDTLHRRPTPPLDCLSCSNRVCLHGEACDLHQRAGAGELSREDRGILCAAHDLSAEEERTLCRISELVYFCLEMSFHRLGVAFCIDLLDQTEVLVRLLRRFFAVHPVCCRVGGARDDEQLREEAEATGRRLAACNPHAQARVLNALPTDLNVVVGLCMGADCLFARASDAPVTSLFVRDRSLANNPIAAIYSEYHLDEVSRVSSTPRPMTAKGDLG